MPKPNESALKETARAILESNGMGVTETAVVQAERILAERLQPFLEAAENANGSLAGLWQSEYETRSSPWSTQERP